MTAESRTKVSNAINQRDLRNALGQFATGVTTIVTRDAAGALTGLTANSFTSVSLDPPLVLWSLRKAARSYEAFRNCGYFVINVLAEHQVSVAQQFSAAREDRFSGIAWTPSPVSKLPILDSVAAWFECKNLNCYDAGDHTIFVGEVFRFAHEERAPLLFHAGAYAQSDRFRLS